MQPSEYSPRDTDPPETAASTALILMPSNPAPKGWKHTITNPNPNLDAPLESLPPEIRRHLLSMMELDALKSLVHASPVFHQQYLLDRKWVLCRSLAATLRSNSLIYEVRAVYESGLKTFWDTRTKPTVKQFVKAYRQGRSSSHNSPFSEAVTLSKELTLEEVLYLAKFHFLIIQPLMQKYINCTSTFLTVGLHVPYDQKKGGLREIEEMRLLRAFYRFQICCNLFGHGYNGRNFRGAPGFAAMEVSALLESLFEPWEIEGIVCIYEFVIGSYERVLPVDWNGHSPFPRQYQYPFFLQRTRFLTDLTHGILFGTISRGLGRFRDLLFTDTHTSHSRWTIQNINVDSMKECFAMGDPFSWFIHERRYFRTALHQISLEEATFQGDKVEDPKGIYPPLGWTLASNGGRIGNSRSWVKREELAWGYVIWDAKRLDSMGVRDKMNI